MSCTRECIFFLGRELRGRIRRRSGASLTQRPRDSEVSRAEKTRVLDFMTSAGDDTQRRGDADIGIHYLDRLSAVRTETRNERMK